MIRNYLNYLHIGSFIMSYSATLLRSTLLFAVTMCSFCCLDYTSSELIQCSQIPTESLHSNLQFLWNKAILHQIDRYAFLILCPLISIIQIIIAAIYLTNRKLLTRPGDIFFAIIVCELCLNIQFLTTAIYDSVHSTSANMPPGFTKFCYGSSLVSAFFDILHFQIIILFPVYVIYVLRFTLKPNMVIWKIIYFIVFSLGGLSTFLLSYFDLLGLNVFGICGITFLRQPSTSIYYPILFGILLLLFIGFGIYTISYFKKHMPNSAGLRVKKERQSKILLYYIIGFTIYMMLYEFIAIMQLVNCMIATQKLNFLVLITVFNILRLSQFLFLAFIVTKNEPFRKCLKKSFKRLFPSNRADESSDSSKQASYLQPDQIPNQEDPTNLIDFFLDIKLEQDEVDLLRMSQVMTIIVGIYIAYKEYYNSQEGHSDVEYVEQGTLQPTPYSEQVDSLLTEIRSEKMVKDNKFRGQSNRLRRIYYYEKISFMIDPMIIQEYVIDTSLLPKLGVLKCNMVIYAPRIFQRMLQDDRLEKIFQSFELFENSRKIFDLVQGDGGKSGQFFFFSSDNRYVLKTITVQQFLFIEANLSYFFEHYSREDSLLAKIYGLFTIKGNEIQRTYHLILMKNILGCLKTQVWKTYDLKGSKYDREVINSKNESNESKMTLKDIDFMKLQGRLFIEDSRRQQLRNILERDTLFLKSLNLIDYSFLAVLVHWPYAPAEQTFWGPYQRLPSTKDHDVFYHFGIIDYLQKWDLQKKGQQWWKHFLGKKDISAQQPNKYQSRFMNFVEEITVSDSFQQEFKRPKILVEQQLSLRKSELTKIPPVKEQPMAI